MSHQVEEQIAHLERDVADLSDVVARQANEIELLTRRVAMLMQRGAEQEVSAGGTAPIADQKPPHW